MAAPAIRRRMTTLKRVRVFSAVAPEGAPLVSAAIVTNVNGDVVQCLDEVEGLSFSKLAALVRTAWSFTYLSCRFRKLWGQCY